MTTSRIGITTYREAARWGVWDTAADVQFTLYSDAVAAAGGVPLLLPPVDPGLAVAAVQALDGLVLSGGADLDPARYASPRSPHTGPAQPHRDTWELALTAAALDHDLPLLGICRGMQVLNVALGGSLHQHLPEIVGHPGHAPVPGQFARHDVFFAPGSLLHSVLGDRAEVATHHHQAVRDLGAGLTATGWADDGTVEAVELGGKSWAVGVQWHPEAHDGGALFSGFIHACAAARPLERR